MQLTHRGKTLENPPIFPNRAIREFYGGSVGPPPDLSAIERRSCSILDGIQRKGSIFLSS